MEELLQTASVAPVSAGGEGGSAVTEPLDCTGPAPSNALATGTVFGEGEEPTSWLFAQGTYGVSAGPGLSVVARDTFRVYVNGNLLAESQDARAPLFIPLSLPPGENVIAVVVNAEEGAPAALVHVDELSRAYESDNEWKVSTAPTGGWQDVGYDDSAWSTASELANLGDLPGCDPLRDFPTSSQARWIGAESGATGSLALRKVIRIEPTGFGAGTTGGGTESPVVVSTWNELVSMASSPDPAVIVLAEGVFDFRRTGSEIEDIEVCPQVCASDATKTTYKVLVTDETCADPLVMTTRDDRVLGIRSDKTIIGLGRGAAVRGVTFDLQESENIILRNLAIYDVNAGLIEAGDGLGMTMPSGVWVDHTTIKWVSDGFTDILAGSNAITLSYMHYDGENDAACDGQHPRTSQIADAEVTIHHSRYDHTTTRSPLIVGSQARVHIFNNLYSNAREWAVGSSCLATVLLEGSTFENVDAVSAFFGCADTGELGYLNLPAGSNLYRDSSPVFLGGDGEEPHNGGFSPPYDYVVEAATEAWPLVVSRAGAGGPWALPLVRD